jgi:hypothetical protein
MSDRNLAANMLTRVYHKTGISQSVRLLERLGYNQLIAGGQVRTTRFPTFTPILISSIILNILGWVGLFLLITFTLPTLFPRWLFFFLLTLAISGLALPFVYLLHRRFSEPDSVDAGVLVREALFGGIFVDLLAWLQLGRMLTTVRGFLIFAGFAVIEILLRWRERSKWRPKEPPSDE